MLVLSSSAAHQPACRCSTCSPPPTTGCLSCSGGTAGGGWAVLQGDSSGLSSHSPYAANAATRQQQDVKLDAAIACWRLPEADGSTSSSDRRIRSNSPASVSNTDGSSASMCGKGVWPKYHQNATHLRQRGEYCRRGNGGERGVCCARWETSCSHLCSASASLPVSRTTGRRRRRTGGRLPPHPQRRRIPLL